MREAPGPFHTFPLLTPEDVEAYQKSDSEANQVSAQVYLTYIMREALRLRDEVDNLEGIRAESEIDPLTGCYKKEAFTERLDHILGQLRAPEGHRAGDVRAVIVFFIDVWLFKAINETYGYDIGDESLWYIAANLLLACRSDPDIVGRFAGDEFMICAPVHGDEDPEEVAKSIHQRINDNIEAHNRKLSPNSPPKRLTIGHIVVRKEDPPLPGEQVITQASVAMKEEKERQRREAGIRAREE